MTALPSELPPVNCNGCTKCCQQDLVPLHSQEVHKFPHQKAPPSFARKHVYFVLKIDPATSSCVNLGERGCNVFPKVPFACSSYDCRKAAFAISQMTDEQMAIRLANPRMRPALEEGCTRMAKDSPEHYAHMGGLIDKLMEKSDG